MKIEIEVEIDEDEWEYLGFRRANFGEWYLHNETTLTKHDGPCEFSVKRPVFRRKDVPAMHFKPGWIGMDVTGRWWHYSEKPKLGDKGWIFSRGNCSYLSDSLGFDFTGDWKESLRRV